MLKVVSTVPLAPGSHLGKYEVIKRLAAGGMAEILLARVSSLPGLQKLMVLKRILPEYADRADFVQMFVDEARIATTLQHSNLVQTFDVGIIDGHHFMAMEYLHGEDVRMLLSTLAKTGRRLPLEHALNIVIGICAGLHYAHEKVDFDGRALNIVHRDVNPQNVIVTYEGGVKLLDFGIAKAANRFGSTRHGTIKGKVPYMSPEQCRGDALDRRSDIFSAGIMLYELTLTKRLFRGPSDYEVLKQIVEGTIAPPSTIDPGYDPALEAIVMRALEKNPERRFQNARDLQVELERLVREGRMAASALALQQFVEELFGNRIEVLREAQAQGSVELLSQVIESRLSVDVLEEDEQLPETVAATPPARQAAAPRHPWRWAAAGGGLVAAAASIVFALFWSIPLPPQQRPSPPVLQQPPTRPPQPSAAPSEARPPAPAPPTRHTRPKEPREPKEPKEPKEPREPKEPPPPPAVTGKGTLVVATNPWCRVTVDGIDRGSTPVRAQLSAGPHVVLLKNPEYGISRSLTVQIRPNETVRKNLDFGE